MNSKGYFSCCGIFLIIITTFFFSGCIARSDYAVTNPKTFSKPEIDNKKIGCLPIKTQTSLAPDSVTAIRNLLNQQIAPTVHSKLSSCNIIDFSETTEIMNNNDLLPIFEKFFATYDNTGVVDKNAITTIGKALSCDYLLASRFKAEKLDMVISSVFGASLEALLIDVQSGKIIWGGSGDWKKGGILGLGGTTADEASKSLLAMTFESL